MANKLPNLLRKVFLGSLASIIASNANANKTDILMSSSAENDNKVESRSDKKPDLSLKLLLKKTTNGEWAFMSHRSHRSHSSHRSHYSSSSGGGGSYSTPSSSPSSQPNYNSGSGGPSNSTTALQLGARTLKKGMYGTDVTELVNILLRKKYLILENGVTQASGPYTFDQAIENAVKKFQLDNGLKNDGVCGSATIYYLKK